ncbi:MAG: response regulator [Magnetospiraceae bacterium]
MAALDLDFSGISALLVDDNPLMRRMVRTALESFQLGEVKEASDGANALSLLSGGYAADILVVDYHMPNMNGLGLTNALRNAPNSPNKFITIFMVTANSNWAQIAAARDAGVNEFLAKPLTARALLYAIAGSVRNPRPFVETDGYFGPDRRRHPYREIAFPDRRTVPARYPTAAGLDQQAIETLLNRNTAS